MQRILSSTLASALTAVSALGGEPPTPGVKVETIKYASSADQTGPLLADLAMIPDGKPKPLVAVMHGYRGGRGDVAQDLRELAGDVGNGVGSRVGNRGGIRRAGRPSAAGDRQDRGESMGQTKRANAHQDLTASSHFEYSVSTR
jgi:hypothetical protein